MQGRGEVLTNGSLFALSMVVPAGQLTWWSDVLALGLVALNVECHYST